ncbi:MAG: hypothetical protein A2Z99_10190 [Treponema sp. GWB1_62_6]|nr:MAG: hypothetical protein A2001_04625 [Treponema sp. GWC1_61_84]OHE66318.1 MAG: hypothetical protein A2Z99_10190 [Treponema sp. GWB1_62_6]OHE73705.1 MAG: hypothetical protein A2413_10395 [Treponema sp. RIFOXYC1_FULL_61_9]HCM27646.1 hypothetical protein [Treponema sp.]
MKIRFKLFLLIIGMLVLLSGAASVFFILNAPVQRIERERGVLNTLLDAIQTLLVEANRLDSATFVSERPIFDAAIARLGEAFKHVQGVQYLRISDPALAESIDIIERLNALNDDNLRSIKEIYDQLYADAKTIFMFPDGITFRRFHQREYVINKDPRPFEIAQYNLARFESASVNLNYSLESSAQIITEQGAVIDSRIKDIQTRAMLVSALSIGGLFILIGLIAALAANAIAKDVIVIATGVGALASGDLSVKFRLRAKDEIGVLARGMNDFIHTLDDSLLGIKDAAIRNAAVRDRLHDATRTTGSSISELRNAVRDVEAQAKRLDEKIGETRASVTSIAGGVGQLDDRITDQIAMVEEATASITQMLATIGNMARLAENDRILADSLVRTSDSGREVFQTAFMKIEAITERVGKIEEMIQIIDTIAGQTNLLAMNAAIEAAHAGEAGRGFAVVADEIRKLAEASAEGSREIAASVRSIVESIASAREGSGETTKAFAEIEASIRAVSRSVSEISSSLAETDTGGRQILTAMTSLRELSGSISGESRLVAENARTIDSSMGELDRIAENVRASMGAIAGRSDDIASTADTTAELANELASLGEDLQRRVSLFKTSCEDDGGTIAKGGVCETA